MGCASTLKRPVTGRPCFFCTASPILAMSGGIKSLCFARAGLCAIVPDLRGRGRSERPQGVAAYALPELVADATGILDAFGIDRAHIVGHDWGAALAWALAALAPERVDRLVVMSVGFPGAVRPDRKTLEQ